MATKTFTSVVELQLFVNDKIKKAIMSASRIITEQLRNIIDVQYYNDPEFYPNIYKRTFQFLDSATYELLGSNMAQIGIDTDSMHYYNNFDPDAVIDMAAQSQHGSPLYQTSTEDFWTTFTRWSDENVINILRNELQKQGLKLVK
jgi:hypothetical protein